jgi:hypothetical protein
VSKAVNNHNYHSITTLRSQSMEYALLQPPHCTFLHNAFLPATSSKQLIIYNLPPLLTEYLSTALQEEANSVRSRLFLSSNLPDNEEIIISFNANHGSFLGVPPDATDVDLVLYVHSNNVVFIAQLALTTLDTLSKLDQSTALQLLPETESSNVVVLVGIGGREHALAIVLS